jgi:hypothetical protein
MLFGGSIRFNTAALRSGEYPMSSSYPAHLRNRGKKERRTTTLTHGEMQRVADTGRPNEELCKAEELRQWLVNRWEDEFIDKRTMMKNGPGHLRDGDTLDFCIKKLEEHRWLVRGAGQQVINGANSRTYWRIERPRALA